MWLQIIKYILKIHNTCISMHYNVVVIIIITLSWISPLCLPRHPSVLWLPICLLGNKLLFVSEFYYLLIDPHGCTIFVYIKALWIITLSCSFSSRYHNPNMVSFHTSLSDHKICIPAAFILFFYLLPVIHTSQLYVTDGLPLFCETLI